ncbi:MAG: nitrophenyl compound nitroreductase subunit ArsF family protein [Salinivirgaceae bacterium]|jgi:hypothetical protein|nr:nitrophenyl compound nitroreductase subunit ArsF family protein [Salinivirgaceae bacterium]
MNLKKCFPLFTLGIVLIVSCQGRQKHTADFNNLQRSLVNPDSSLLKNERTELAVYYFHNTRRCATCNAVEAVTIEALKEYYGEKVKFSSLNLEEESTEELAKSMKISGQTLIIIYGDKQFDLTNEAFMYARNSPEKLKQKLKATIDPFL